MIDVAEVGKRAYDDSAVARINNLLERCNYISLEATQHVE